MGLAVSPLPSLQQLPHSWRGHLCSQLAVTSHLNLTRCPPETQVPHTNSFMRPQAHPFELKMMKGYQKLKKSPTNALR